MYKQLSLTKWRFQFLGLYSIIISGEIIYDSKCPWAHFDYLLVKKEVDKQIPKKSWNMTEFNFSLKQFRFESAGKKSWQKNTQKIMKYYRIKLFL